MLLLFPVIGNAGTREISPGGHRLVTGVVSANKNGILTVKTPTGSFTLNENVSRRHGHHVPRVGEEVVLTLDENNAVLDAHPKGDTEDHTFYTGKLVYMGKMKKEVKIVTVDGEKVFPIERLEIKTKPFEEGTMVIIEVNEGGTVIDLRPANE
jgi:hypothetical protein